MDARLGKTFHEVMLGRSSQEVMPGGAPGEVRPTSSGSEAAAQEAFKQSTVDVSTGAFS